MYVRSCGGKIKSVVTYGNLINQVHKMKRHTGTVYLAHSRTEKASHHLLLSHNNFQTLSRDSSSTLIRTCHVYCIELLKFLFYLVSFLFIKRLFIISRHHSR